MILVEYKHLKLLKKMLEQGVSQSKIIEYFIGEGYTESEVIEAINEVERETELEQSLKELKD
ncbi:MAG: hypothetical protein JW834_01005 [Candidatus Diapherotrites archaeon]|nr:hypothetical protein [Candidatus Diapherotrites archaeon]